MYRFSFLPVPENSCQAVTAVTTAVGTAAHAARSRNARNVDANVPNNNKYWEAVREK